MNTVLCMETYRNFHSGTIFRIRYWIDIFMKVVRGNHTTPRSSPNAVHVFFIIRTRSIRHTGETEMVG